MSGITESSSSICLVDPIAREPSSTSPFTFTGLWNYLQAIKNCTRIHGLPPNEYGDPRLVWHKNDTFLTYEAALRWTGETARSWNPYPLSDILWRLQAWKFPLIALISLFPRPPLSFSVELFTIFHLVGDPIDTIASMLFTIHVCWLRAEKLKALYGNTVNGWNWRALTLVMQAWDECSGRLESWNLESM